MSVSTRRIGTTEVSPIGYGCMGLSASYGSVEPDEERFKVLDRAYELGARHWDTSSAYGDSELLLGKWFKKTGKRSDIFLATKFGIMPDGSIKGDAAFVKESCALALERLGVEYIDLFYVHRIDQTVPIEVTVGALAELVKEGKVKYIGLSECTARDLRRAHAVHPVSAVQFDFSPFELRIEEPEVGILQTARELGVTIVAFSPLGRGLLTGQYTSPDDFEETDFRRKLPRFSKENFPKILEVSERIKDVASAHGATAGQASLAWILAQGDDFITIPGTKKIKYLEENMKGLDVQLSDAEVGAIRKIALESVLPGDRYPEYAMKWAAAESPELEK